MKYLWIVVLLLCFPDLAGAQSNTAVDRASCNASFHLGCVSNQTSTASSSGFAAPVGMLGSSALEGGLVALLIAGGIARRIYCHATGSGRKRNRCGAIERAD